MNTTFKSLELASSFRKEIRVKFVYAKTKFHLDQVLL